MRDNSDRTAREYRLNKELDRFLQSYAVEKATLEARRRGHSISEQPLADGSIKLTIRVAGGAA